MRISNNFMSGPVNFKAKLSPELMEYHQYNVEKNHGDSQHSKDIIKRLENVLPDYTINRVYPYLGSIIGTLLLVNPNNKHVIKLYGQDEENKAMITDDMSSINLERLADILESTYGDQTPVLDEGIVVLDEELKENKNLASVISVLQDEFNFKPGQTLEIKPNIIDEPNDPLINDSLNDRENLKLTLRTTDSAGIVKNATSDFYFPISEKIDAKKWAGYFIKSIRRLSTAPFIEN